MAQKSQSFSELAAPEASEPLDAVSLELVPNLRQRRCLLVLQSLMSLMSPAEQCPAMKREAELVSLG